MIFKLQLTTNPNLLHNRVNLNPAVLTQLLERFGEQLPFPLTFRLSSLQKDLYVSVNEFIAMDETIQISTAYADFFEGDYVNCQYVELRKCTKATLLGNTNNEDMRGLLEAHLRSYSVISVGMELSLEYGRQSKKLDFVIVGLEPDLNCICLNTTIEVDINSIAEVSAEVDALKWCDNKLVIEREVLAESKYRKIPLPNGSDYTCNIVIKDGVVDLYLSETQESPSIIDHSFYSVELGMEGARSLKFSSSSNLIYLGLDLISKTATCDITFIRRTKLEIESHPDKVRDDEFGLAGKQCSNCKSMISQDKISMHEAFCFRNNVFCVKCGKVTLKTQTHLHCDGCSMSFENNDSIEKHQIVHTPLTCSCGSSLTISEVANHKIDACVDRYITCRFCHLLVRAGQLSRTAKDLILGSKFTEHESDCGARTIECQKCNKAIQLKDIGVHSLTHRLFKPVVTFQICHNKCCTNILDPLYPNALNLCHACFKPFFSPRHDPSNQKQSQKIVQRYHYQLTVGCGSVWCANTECSTFTGIQLKPNDSAIESITLLKRGVRSFCVSNEISRRRVNLDKLFQMVGGSVEGCLQALMDNGYDIERASNSLI